MNAEELKKAYWMAYAAMQSVREEHTRSLIDYGDSPAKAREIWKRSGGKEYIEAAWEARSNCDAHGLRHPERNEKCPLCDDGGEISFNEVLNTEGDIAIAVKCSCCGLSLWDVFETSADAMQAWRKFVKRFPSVFRVHPGDILIAYTFGAVEVTGRCVETGEVYVKKPCPEEMRARKIGGGKIAYWPWELDAEWNPKK